MQTIEELLPLFQKLGLYWYQFTLDNADYAATLAIVVWLLTAIFYSIRLAFVKRRRIIAEKAWQEIHNKLEEAQQQLQTAQQQLTEVNEQAEQAQQRAAALEQNLAACNRQLAEGLTSLAGAFEFGETILSAEDAGLWRQYGALVGQIGERFRSEQQAKAQLQQAYQAESAKLAEKDVKLNAIQIRLDSQIEQLAKLEVAAVQHKTVQQQLDQTKQQLAEALQQQQNDAARLADFERQARNWAVSQAAQPVAPTVVQPAQVVVAPPVVEKPEPIVELPREVAPPVVESIVPEPVAVAARVDVAPVLEPKAVAPQPADVAPVKSASANAGKWKNMFGNAMQKIAKMDEKLGSPATSPVKEVEEEPVADVRIEEPAPIINNVVEDIQAADAEKQPAASMGAKLGGLFGGRKKSAPTEVASQQEIVVEPVAEPEPLPVAEADEKAPGRIAGLFGKFKKG